jgi:signal transduction histidine kinase
VVALAVVFAFGIDTPWWAPAILLTAVTAAATAIGLYVGTRRAYLDELRDRADRLQREHDQQAALAVAAERARIAREMHDIVAHHITVMVALSDGAAAASSRSPERAAEVMATVSATGRQALADTRRLLGVLRDDLGGEADLQPLPTLSDLDELLGRVRDTGLPVRYEVHGATPSIPAGIQLTLYRLVQEALTNTMKHAGPGATATVCVRYATDQVRLEVTDDGGGSPRPAAARGPGRGLAGMRDRVSAFGGDVSTGPTDGHGWRVSATMRLDPAVAS